jgi:hypothetical protein
MTLARSQSITSRSIEAVQVIEPERRRQTVIARQHPLDTGAFAALFE